METGDDMSDQKYETLTLGQALDAVANGERVEFKHVKSISCWIDLRRCDEFSAIDAKDWQFRRAIQKKKKLVPFTQETWPIGAWVKYCGNVYPTGSVSSAGVHVIGCGNKGFADLLNNEAKIAVIENGKVVGKKPCGIEVEE